MKLKIKHMFAVAFAGALALIAQTITGRERTIKTTGLLAVGKLPLSLLLISLCLILPEQLTAQTFNTVYSFSAAVNGYNADGAYPTGLVLSSNVLYGTAILGGLHGGGTVFAVNTDGSGIITLYNFTMPSGNPQVNGDGAYPPGDLILSENTLYGPTQAGSWGSGTLFAINTDGTGSPPLYTFTQLHENSSGWFVNSDGGAPNGLVSSGGTLFGTAHSGGTWGQGTVFALNTDGTGFTTLHTFAQLPNSEGASPFAGLVLSGASLYGTAWQGGPGNHGTVFGIDTDGTRFRVLHTFSAVGGNVPYVTNADGAYPRGRLLVASNTLYGTAWTGGGAACGTVFKVETDGTGFAILHTFTALGTDNANSDGAFPTGGLILFGNTLYGTATGGGSSGYGTVFAVNTDGTGFRVLHGFTNSDGQIPNSLLLSGNTLYGTASQGGASGRGTIFSITLPVVQPQLTITPVETNVILRWPPTPVGFTLESTTNLDPPVIWTTNFPPPVLVNGQNTVTNPISGAQQFYRLSQ
jgi:uncharacterized repeat protein (TIGR03803 family)